MVAPFCSRPRLIYVSSGLVWSRLVCSVLSLGNFSFTHSPTHSHTHAHVERPRSVLLSILQYLALSITRLSSRLALPHLPFSLLSLCCPTVTERFLERVSSEKAEKLDCLLCFSTWQSHPSPNCPPSTPFATHTQPHIHTNTCTPMLKRTCIDSSSRQPNNCRLRTHRLCVVLGCVCSFMFCPFFMFSTPSVSHFLSFPFVVSLAVYYLKCT